MANIGFLSYWGWGRGQAYVTLGYVKMLQGEHNCFVLNQVVNDFEKEKEFEEVEVSVTDVKGYFVDPEVFKMWIETNKLDAVVFNEYDQWSKDSNDLVQIARDMGCKVYGFLVLEKYKAGQAERYDRVFAPTVSSVRFYRWRKVRNFSYIPFSVDLKKHNRLIEENEKFTFFHPGGMLGVRGRKNTRDVIEAFEYLAGDKEDFGAELIITSQVSLQFNREVHPNIKFIHGNQTKEEINRLYAQADFLVYPTKWETIGIGVIEAMASGTPSIVTDIPPLNEFIIPNKNGFLVGVDLIRYPEVECMAAEIDYKELSQKMELAMNPLFTGMMKKNAKYIAEKIYNIDKNKHYMLDFLKGDLE